MFFYKFISFNRKDVLKDGVIRFTPATDFNDPFELNPTITSLSRCYIDFISNLNDDEVRKIIFNDDDYMYSSERDGKIEEYREKFHSEISKYGILSLSSNKNINQFLTVSMPDKNDPRANLLMWSHYADSHRGFIIEFEAGFIDGLDIKEVVYTQDRQILTFEDIDENNFDSIFFRKSEEWSYEQEYRGVLPLDKADATKDNGIHLFKLIKSKVKSITFGSRMSEIEKKEIMNIINMDQEYKEVKFNHSYLNDAGYVLNFYYDDGQHTNNPIYGGRLILVQKKFR